MSELSNKELSEIQRELTELQIKLRDFRFGGAGSRVKNVKEGRSTRRTIARLLTEINRRSMQQKVAESVQPEVAQSVQQNVAKSQK